MGHRPELATASRMEPFKRGGLVIASPYVTFAAERGHGQPIGSRFTVTEPRRLAYWDPSIELPETTSTRRAMACPWSPPAPPAVPITTAELIAELFAES